MYGFLGFEKHNVITIIFTSTQGCYVLAQGHITSVTIISRLCKFLKFPLSFHIDMKVEKGKHRYK